MRPLGARVLVKRLEEPRPKSSLIAIPETVDEKPSKFALVLAVGKLLQGGVSVGDVVILKDYAGAPCVARVGEDEVEAHIVPEGDVLAVVEGL